MDWAIPSIIYIVLPKPRFYSLLPASYIHRTTYQRSNALPERHTARSRSSSQLRKHLAHIPVVEYLDLERLAIKRTQIRDPPHACQPPQRHRSFVLQSVLPFNQLQERVIRGSRKRDGHTEEHVACELDANRDGARSSGGRLTRSVSHMKGTRGGGVPTRMRTRLDGFREAAAAGASRNGAGRFDPGVWRMSRRRWWAPDAFSDSPAARTCSIKFVDRSSARILAVSEAVSGWYRVMVEFNAFVYWSSASNSLSTACLKR